MGILIAIEGVDASGKETQTKKLCKKLEESGKKVKKITFPNYESNASAPVKMYLNGDFGREAKKVNPYPASTMYAIDRYASYKEDWEKNYLNGDIVVTDRYTISNMIHQGAKIEDPKEKEGYITWLEDLEYKKMEIPKPNIVIFLNMPFSKSLELMEKRKNKITGEESKDIHEKDSDYIKKSYTNACEVAKAKGWEEIMCVDENGNLRTIEDISSEIYERVTKKLSL